MLLCENLIFFYLLETSFTTTSSPTDGKLVIILSVLSSTWLGRLSPASMLT